MARNRNRTNSKRTAAKTKRKPFLTRKNGRWRVTATGKFASEAQIKRFTAKRRKARKEKAEKEGRINRTEVKKLLRELYAGLLGSAPVVASDRFKRSKRGRWWDEYRVIHRGNPTEDHTGYRDTAIASVRRVFRRAGYALDELTWFSFLRHLEEKQRTDPNHTDSFAIGTATTELVDQPPEIERAFELFEEYGEDVVENIEWTETIVNITTPKVLLKRKATKGTGKKKKRRKRKK
jgi:hypothetical protein